MKNTLIYLILIVILLSACQSAPAEEKFVNPDFNNPLNALSIHNPWDMKMSPTQISYSHAGTTVSQECILTDNQQLAVSFDCEGLYDKKTREIVICKILPNELYIKGIYVSCYTGDKKDCQSLPIDKYWSESIDEKKLRKIFGRCWPSQSNYIIHSN